MSVNLKCPCGCTMKFDQVEPCVCGMYKLETAVLDGKNVVSVVSV